MFNLHIPMNFHEARALPAPYGVTAPWDIEAMRVVSLAPVHVGTPWARFFKLRLHQPAGFAIK